MLSSPESHVRVSFNETGNSNKINYKLYADGMDHSNVPEDTTVISQEEPLDIDMHWEMNYHEAAIFLEVLVF